MKPPLGITAGRLRKSACRHPHLAVVISLRDKPSCAEVPWRMARRRAEPGGAVHSGIPVFRVTCSEA